MKKKDIWSFLNKAFCELLGYGLLTAIYFRLDIMEFLFHNRKLIEKAGFMENFIAPCFLILVLFTVSIGLLTPASIFLESIVDDMRRKKAGHKAARKYATGRMSAGRRSDLRSGVVGIDNADWEAVNHLQSQMRQVAEKNAMEAAHYAADAAWRASEDARLAGTGIEFGGRNPDLNLNPGMASTMDSWSSSGYSGMNSGFSSGCGFSSFGSPF